VVFVDWTGWLAAVVAEAEAGGEEKRKMIE
jgi:hypothetical protein